MKGIKNCSTKMLQLIVIILFTLAHFSRSRCIEVEREALMVFKGSLIDKKNRLSSWTGSDCCSWYGITCHNLTGHVQVIDLMYSDDDSSSTFCNGCILGGHINSSILKLEQLEYLDLSFNDFEGLSIPSFLGSFRKLQYLNLVETGIIGEIPQQLGNLTNLKHLSLGGDYSYPSSFTTSFSAKSLNWIIRLSSLQSLELHYTNLSECIDWLDSLNKLSSLSSLALQDCQLGSTRSDVNLTSLLSLDLSFTSVGSTLPPWLFNLTSLKHLWISMVGLRGPIPNTFEKLTNLATLDLSFNPLGSTFPDSLCSLTHLTNMYLSYTNLNGSLPFCLSNLTSLTRFYVSNNKLSGDIPSVLCNLTQLITLDLSYNQLTGKFLLALGNLTNLQEIDVSENLLDGELSESSFEGLRSLRQFIINGNQFVLFNVNSGWIPPFQILKIGMDSIFVGTQIPLWLQTQRKLFSLIMSNGNITGPVLTSDAINDASLGILQLSGNNISGNIPDKLCNFKNLVILSLANNQLTGRIPLCFGKLLHLDVLDLANNRLSGHVPMELGSLKYLGILHLNGNKLSGELPASMQNLTFLITLDLGKNELEGCIPKWIGTTFSRLQHLRLESNNFSSEILVNLCELSTLRILNLAHNNLFGSIPPCLGNLSAMLDIEDESALYVRYGDYTDTLMNSMKGTELEYSSTLPYSKFISLSGNRLHGEIPEELMNLTGLQSLNLSNNALIGRIPEKIGNVKHLESLDLSMNQLSGTIPQSLVNIDALTYLNLSFNNLEGKIPSGNHFDTLAHPSSFEGNSGVCGKLLNRICPDDDGDSVQSSRQNGTDSKDDGGEFEWLWIYAGIGPGFAVGFLGVIFILYFNKAWR